MVAHQKTSLGSMALKLIFPSVLPGSLELLTFPMSPCLLRCVSLFLNPMKEGDIVHFKRLVLGVSHITSMCTTDMLVYARGTGKSVV